MFSPQQNGAPPQSVRTSRRRPRPLSNEGSINPPKSKKQRLGISSQTFLPPDAAPEMEEAKSQKVAALVRHNSPREPPPGPQREIAVRAKKSRSGDRISKGDGSQILTTNDTYTVSRLPALPDRLSADTTVHQHGAIYSDSGYALTLTHSHAIVWPYAVNIQSPETFTFALSQPSKHVSDSLPLGSLVSASASSSEPGLVVVIPTSGKITYWESISSAATLDLRLQRNGVELSIPGMFSGEEVIQILNAESAGFVLTFSTGRIAYMNVRDGQGRPSISVHFLRGGSGPTSGGIFGSIRNVLSSSALRGDIAAVRAGKPEKVGERNVVLATTKGKIQSWNIHRGGHASITGEVEGREAIVMAIKATTATLSDLLIEGFEIHDFTYTPKPVIESQLSDRDDGSHLLLLVSLAHRGASQYFLVEVILKRSELLVGNIRAITSYTTPVNRSATSKPRLYLPNPALIAYVVFDRAVVVISMAKQPDSPDLQLRAESHILPQSFEDVIDFRHDMSTEIVGSGMEEPHGASHATDDPKSRRHKAKHPATVLLVRGGGVLRVAATDIIKLSSINAQQVTAKSKLEQAVFFGNIEKNPLSFTVRPELQFQAEEVGSAALELSHDILRSSSPHIKSNLAVDQNLRKRSAALQDLAKYLKASGVTLDRLTKWKLLWDAERIAAATLIWKRYDACIKEKPEGQKRGLLTEVVEFIHENYKTEPVAEAGELDRVRHWFIKDIWNLEVAVPWAYQVIKYTYQDGQKEHDYVMEIVSEANDMVLGGLQGAYDFRTANLDLYGLGTEELEHGILKAEYEDLPEFWTSTFFIAENLRKQAELAGMLLKEYWGKVGGQGQPNVEVVNKVQGEFASLLDVAIRSNTERTRWDLAQDSQDLHEEANQIMDLQSAVQDEQISILAIDLKLPDAAIALAEKHELLPVLATVLQYEMNLSSIKLREPGISGEVVDKWGRRSRHLKKLVDHWFAKFGRRWAKALFEHEITFGSMTELLDDWQEQQPYLTEFLRSKLEYAKISWINDIMREEDYGKATATLFDLGLNREPDLWSKKIELSMGKMALLASRKHRQTDGILIPDGGKAELTLVHNSMGLMKIQDQAYEYILPSIHNAIDENAETQLALEAHSNKALRKQPMFTRLLADSMSLLVKHEAMDASKLIDLLTLIGDQAETYDPEFFQSQRFYLALQATRYGLSSKEEQILTQRIIWRRCMLKDNWSKVNNTAEKDDQQVSELVTGTALYQTLRACFKNRLFEKDSNVKPMSPQDVIGAGTEELGDRLAGNDASFRESIMKDMQSEDNALEPMMQKHRLENWYETILDRAKQDYEDELAEETADGNQMQEASLHLMEVEKEIKENEQTKANSLLHSKPRYKPKAKANGSLGMLRSSLRA